MNKQLFFLIISIISLFNNQVTFAYDDKTTHPALTHEIVKFYNSFSHKKISDEEKEWIVKGSILEDTEPRYINHFYDPIYKVGWKGGSVIGFLASSEEAVSALDWVHNQELQDKYKDYRGNQTWEKALYEYVKNENKEKAFMALGHVLHLLEDMSVPDHTRNDTHIGDSPYENYSTKFTRGSLSTSNDLKKQSIQAFKFDTLNEYFETVAEYSNKYFFSKDTINDPKYEKPEIVENNGGFGYGVDKNGEKFKLVRADLLIIEGKPQVFYFLDKDEKDILNSYFSHLSQEAVLAGSGVVDLFFKEAEKMIKDEVSLKAPTESSEKIFSLLGLYKKTENNINSLTQKTIENFSNIFNKIIIAKNVPANALETVSNQSTLSKITAEMTKDNALEVIPIVQKEVQSTKVTQLKKDKIVEQNKIKIPKIIIPIVPITQIVPQNIIIPNLVFGGGGGSSIGPPVQDSNSLDTIPPVISIIGDDLVDIIKDDDYIDAGATAIDEIDGEVSVDISSNVDISTVGLYTVTYTASDVAGNVSTIIRKVNVYIPTYITDDILQDTTLSLANSPYVVLNSIMIGHGATLTVEPGVIVKFSDNKGFSVFGKIIAEGTEEKKISFTNLSGAFFSEWNGIDFLDSKGSSITNAIFKYAREVSFLKNSDLTIDNIEMSDSDSGISVYNNSNLKADNVKCFRLSGSCFIGYENSDINLKNLTISDMAEFGTAISIFNFSTLDISDTFFDMDDNPNYNLFEIFNDSKLTLTNSILNSSGNNGDAFAFFNNSVILFDNVQVDSSDNSWGSIINIYNNTNFTLKNSRIKNIGSLLESIIAIFDGLGYENKFSTLTIEKTLFEGEAKVGIDIYDNVKISIDNSIFKNFTDYAIKTNGTISVNVQNNFWGDKSGPYHTILNRSGLGEKVSDNVSFIPWCIDEICTPGSKKEIATFNFSELTPEVVGVVDETNHNISLTVPFGTNLTALLPNIAISPNALINPNNNIAQDFTNPVTYTVTGEDGLTQDYIVTVSVADDPNPLPLPDIINPFITSYTLNGVEDNITINPLTDPVTLVLNSNENVNWMSIKIEKEDDAHVYKNFQSGVNCVDGTNVCTKVWNGLLSGGGLLQNGVYKIKVHIKDTALNEFYDYLLPYRITVSL